MADSHRMLMTVAVAIPVGVILIALARRLGVPAIVLLLAGGVAVGPAGLNMVDPASLGGGLRVVVAIAVGLILFEGGLTLDLKGYRTAPRMIGRLLTVGVAVTWGGAALAIGLLYGSTWENAIVAASLVIVTGPTVVGPLLKRIRLVPRLHGILHWESVLIDPIGVFIAVLCFEWITEPHGASVLVNLGLRVTAGLALGIAGGWLLAWLVNRRIVPSEMVNVFALAWAVLIFGVAERVRSETGLLAVAVAGFVFAVAGPAAARQIRQFKAELTDLLVGTLFILLAAHLRFDQFRDFGLRGLAAVAAVLLVVRPLSVLACSWGLDLSRRERLFLAWVAPRGIVAASMASLIAISLTDRADEEAGRLVETFTYSVIIATIVLHGLTAAPLARLLGLRQPEPTGWLVVGAHELARHLARFIADSGGQAVVLVDTNAHAVRESITAGLAAIQDDARDPALLERRGVTGIGYVLACTDNEDLNARVCGIWARVVGARNVYGCAPYGAQAAADELEGWTVWRRLPRPGLVCSRIAGGDEIVRVARPGEPLPDGALPLATVAGGRVGLVAEPRPGAAGTAAAPTLYLERREGLLLRALRPPLVARLEPSDLRALFETLVERMTEVQPALPGEAIVEELLERERVFPTLLGNGIAVPHTYSESLSERLCALARLPGGLSFGPGVEPVRLAFLVVSPSGDPEGHLGTLAEIARLVNEPATVDALMAAPQADDVIRIVRERL